ncbi:MAG: RHS repeat-associated core domain-containing protein, partial [Candidatus Acidiferrum sp.]
MAWNKADVGNLLETGWSYTAATAGTLTEADLGWQACGADFTWTDGYSTTHYFALPNIETVSSNPNQCPMTGDAFATDSTGFHLYYNYTGYAISIYAPDGTRVWSQTPEIDSHGNFVLAKDANGNYFSKTDDSNSWVLDTLGRIPAKVSTCGTGGGPCYAISNSQGDSNRSNYVTAVATISVNTAFGQSGVTEYSGTLNVLQSITLPDNSSYSFKYDCDSTLNSQVCSSPHGMSAYYGVMTQMTLPSGGQVTYGYTTFSDSYSNKSRWLTSKSTGNGAWSFTPQVISTCSSTQVGCQEKETIWRPDGSSTVNTFTLDNGAWLTQTLQYDSQSNLMATTVDTWDFSDACVLQGCHGHNYIRRLSENVTVPVPGGSSVTKRTAYSYHTPQDGLVTAIDEWGYYPGTSPTFPSIPDRARYISYYSTGTNIINKPLSITLCNNSGSDSACPSGGSKVSQTLITYDSYGAGLTTVSNIANHDDTNYGAGNTQRGNATQIQKWVAGTTYLTTQSQFDTTGQILQSNDPLGNPTTYSYADNYLTETGPASASLYTPTWPTNAYPKTVTQGGLTQTFGYYFGDSEQAVSTDPNNQSTYFYFWDQDDRPTEALYPIGWSLTNYTSATQIDSYGPVADTSPSMSCISCQHDEAILDGYGRKINENLANAPGGAINVDTVYDGVGRVQTVSHAYVNPSDPSHVFETYSYDGLDRQTAVTHPDNESSVAAFGPNVTNSGGLSTQQGSGGTYGYGYPVLTLDETTTKKRQEWIDGFGRIVEVDEPVTAKTPGSGSVSISGYEQSAQVCTQHLAGGDCGRYVTRYDHGTVSITVNGVLSSVSYGQGSTSSSIATGLASAINSNGSINSLVSASTSGSTVDINAKQGGSQTNYSLSAAATTSDSTDFPDGSFYSAASGSALTGGFDAGSSFSTPQVTLYKYDAADNVIQVIQNVQTRTFAYDGLGRPTSITTPEAGTEALTYSISGALCSGDPGNVCQKTDARGVVTTYYYDSSNRLTGKAYTIPQGSNVAAMPNVCTTSTQQSANTCFYYDQGGAAAYALGRRTEMIDPTGSETYTHDAAGRLTQVAKVIGTNIYTTAYQYNPGSELTQVSYPSGKVVQLSYDNVGHLCEIAPSTTTCASATSPYATGYGYDAAGQLTGLKYGNGIYASMGYSSSNREQLSCLDYSTTNRNGTCTHDSTTKFGLNYLYSLDPNNCPNGTPGNEGQIQCITDSVDSGRTANYTYDALGRLSSALTNGSSAYPQWGYTWTYDQYGNRLCQNLTAGNGYQGCLSFASPGGAQTNQPDGWCFDASGNLLAKSGTCPPAAPNFVYDGENRMVADPTAGATYVYDGNGTRVQKCLPNCTSPSSSTVFIFSGSQDIAEYDNGAAPASPSREFVYSDGLPGSGLLATLTGGSSPTITYFHDDHLSWRISTDGTPGSPTYGQVNGSQGSYPFGDSWYSSNGNEFAFTSYQRDAESGLDYAMARYYDSTAGRFCSADPVGGQPDDPQTWDRYSYVRNDPINLTDPNGESWLNWLIDGIIGALAIALPELDPALF